MLAQIEAYIDLVRGIQHPLHRDIFNIKGSQTKQESLWIVRVTAGLTLVGRGRGSLLLI